MASTELGSQRLQRRLERERAARQEAEDIAERTVSVLYDHQRGLELLQMVATAANEASSVEEVLRTTIDGICAHIGWPVGHAYLAKARGAPLVSSGIWHLDDPDAYTEFRRVSAAATFDGGKGLPGMTVAGAKPVWIEDVMVDERFPRRLEIESGLVHGALGFPVLAGSEVVAMVEVFNDHPVPYDERLLSLAGQIGTQLGRVVERTRARDEISRQALHDSLTGLPNRALFLDRLRLALAPGRPVARAPTAVLFIDLDRFKLVNDSLGHAPGDRVSDGGRQAPRRVAAPGRHRGPARRRRVRGPLRGAGERARGRSTSPSGSS